MPLKQATSVEAINVTANMNSSQLLTNNNARYEESANTSSSG